MSWKDRWRWWAGVAIGVAAWLAGPVHAQLPLELDPDRQPVQLTLAEAWLDATGEVSLDHVATAPALPWRPAVARTIYPLGTHKALWFRFTLPQPPTGERWYLEIPYAAVDLVTLFEPAEDGGFTSQRAGDTMRVAEWPVPHRHPLLPLAAGAGTQPRTYLLKVENSQSFSAPLQLVSESHLGRGEQRMALILGMYFGLAALTVVLAVVGAVTLRDAPYALCALTVGLMGLTQASLTGMAGLHLWPNFAWWNDVAPLVLPVLAVGTLVWFVAAVVSMRERSPNLHAVLAGTCLLGAAVAMGVMVIEPSLRISLMVPYLLCAAVVGIGSLLWAARRGDRFAAWLLLGSLPVAIGGALPLARSAGLIAVSFWTIHGMQIGLAIELPILLVMLMVRSQNRREHARRIQGLDRIDPATGLLNAQVFHERLVRLIRRSERLKIRSAVLLVDITNLEQIRHDFDRASAQELPLRVAGRLLSVARDIDSVARLSDHRFGLLLEGPLKADEVAEAGPRVVARCLMPFKNRPLEWSAQVRVAQGLIPMDGNDADQLIGQLEMLLVSAPPEGKRAVLMLARPAAPGGRAAVPQATTTS